MSHNFAAKLPSCFLVPRPKEQQGGKLAWRQAAPYPVRQLTGWTLPGFSSTAWGSVSLFRAVRTGTQEARSTNYDLQNALGTSRREVSRRPRCFARRDGCWLVVGSAVGLQFGGSVLSRHGLRGHGGAPGHQPEAASRSARSPSSSPQVFLRHDPSRPPWMHHNGTGVSQYCLSRGPAYKKTIRRAHCRADADKAVSPKVLGDETPFATGG